MKTQLVLENIGVQLPQRRLFSEINWTLYDSSRIALVGRNGSGKSTLLRIMAGHAEPTDGNRTEVGKDLKIGFLDQSLLDKAVVSAEKEGLAKQSAVDFLVRHEDEHGKVEAIEEWEVRKMLDGLGFSETHMECPMENLSGGWLLRVFIAKALLEKPDMLLLDEPTNHLDISSIQWLEDFLVNEYQGSLILITHDVTLQKRTTNQLAVIHGGNFYFIKNLNDYLSFQNNLEEQKRIIEKNIDALQKKIDINMEFFLKFRAKAQTAARAQGKYKAAQDWQEEQRQLKERLTQLQGAAFNLKFRFAQSAPGSQFPLSLYNLSFRYSDNSPWLVKNLSFDLKRGQKVAIIGDNGVGKTTLLNLIAGRLKPNEGEVKWGHGMEFGYFGQHQLDELSLEDTLDSNVKQANSSLTIQEVRSWLGAFGFSSDTDVAKKAKILSGGERARLALLRVLVRKINFCLLDEPTNHLDIETKELLIDALKEYSGTVVFVSHDREFIQGLADRIIFISRDHEIIDHIGDFESFVRKYPKAVRHQDDPTPQKKEAAPKVVDSQSSQLPQLTWEEKKKIKNQIKSSERKIADLEVVLQQIGEEKHKIEASGTDFAKIQELDSQMMKKMLEWEQLSTLIEDLRKKVE